MNSLRLSNWNPTMPTPTETLAQSVEVLEGVPQAHEAETQPSKLVCLHESQRRPSRHKITRRRPSASIASPSSLNSASPRHTEAQLAVQGSHVAAEDCRCFWKLRSSRRRLRQRNRPQQCPTRRSFPRAPAAEEREMHGSLD